MVFRCYRKQYSNFIIVVVPSQNKLFDIQNKCAQYWPDVNDTMKKGDFNIKNVGNKIYANYIVRQFKVLNSKVRNPISLHIIASSSRYCMLSFVKSLWSQNVKKYSLSIFD